MGDIPEHEDRSVQDRLELALEIAEKATAQYVELAAESGRKWQAVEEEISVLKKAVANAAVGVGSSKPKVPEPKTFAGARSSKDLENFLWDMEHYFSVAKIGVDGQVDIAVMYLSGDAKLWWRTRTKEDLNAGRPKVETWESLKRELKEQFLPNNTSWIAREDLKKLRQDGSVRDYVKKFSSLILDVDNMSEEDRMFNFLSGLQPWAQLELRRQKISDLSSAIAAADGLADFRAESSEGAAGVSGVSSRPRDMGEMKRKKRFGGEEPRQAAGVGRSDVKAKGKGTNSNLRCFICEGNHFARECPKREKLNAIVVEDGDEDTTYANPMRVLNGLSLIHI